MSCERSLIGVRGRRRTLQSFDLLLGAEILDCVVDRCSDVSLTYVE